MVFITFLCLIIKGFKQLVVSCIYFSGVMWACEEVNIHYQSILTHILTNRSQRTETFTVEKYSTEETYNKLMDSKHLFHSELKSIITNRT